MENVENVVEKSRKRKGNASEKPVQQFQFVNANPQSRPEREDVRALVRANATTFRWREVKKANVRPSTTRTLLQGGQPANGSLVQRIAVTESGDSHTSLEDAAHPDHLVEDTHAFIANIKGSSTQPRALALNNRQWPHIITPRVSSTIGISLPTPLNTVGVSYVDPFETYPSELPRRLLSESLTQGW
jgi:hypothetical protein